MERPEPTSSAAAAAAGCAPPAQPCPEPGQGFAVTARVAGASALVRCAASSPLQLRSPAPRGRCAWLVAASLGGGLVAGDDVRLALEIGAGSAALLTTQASTKVYRSTGSGASQRLDARVGPGALLAVLPHPVSCFAGARYRQAQRLELAPGASLLWLDALAAGRVARGERWAAADCRTRLEISRGGALLLADALRLVPGEGSPVAERLAGVELLATAVALGPALARHAAGLAAALAAAPADPGAPVLAAASPLGDGVLVRVAARTVEAGLAFLRDRLAFAADVTGVDPFSRTP